VLKRIRDFAAPVAEMGLRREACRVPMSGDAARMSACATGRENPFHESIVIVGKAGAGGAIFGRRMFILVKYFMK
jgi:hypothetical protein